VLIVRPSALGDVCRTVPVLASLKRAWPDTRVDWLVQEGFAEAVQAHPNLGQVVAFPRRGLGKWYTPRGAALARDLVRQLRTGRYDLVLDCQGLARSGLLTRATGAPHRLGHADARELAWMGYTQRVQPRGALHTVDRMLTLVEALGIPVVRDMQLHPAPRDLAQVDADDRLRGRRFAVVAPTSRWPGKRWPADRFALIATALLANAYERVVIVGSAAERDQCGPLLELAARESRVVDLVGATSVGGLLAVIARSALVIANDSAALHMAVGLDKPLVALYGPTDVAKVGPYRRERDVIQHANPGERLDHKDELAGRAMMERITVDEVLARVQR
jgi:lipopolysaccharide heptosyltransferase I